MSMRATDVIGAVVALGEADHGDSAASLPAIIIISISTCCDVICPPPLASAASESDVADSSTSPLRTVTRAAGASTGMRAALVMLASMDWPSDDAEPKGFGGV